MKRIPALTLAATLLLGLAAGCSHQASADAPAARRLPRVQGSDYPLTLVYPNGDRSDVAAAPQRILPANAGTVDFLSLLVEPARVVALPEASDGYSRLAEGGGDGAGDWSELPRFPSYVGEAVLALDPDLVLTHTWQRPETSALLQRSGLCVLSLPTPRTWSEVLETLELYGRVLGVESRAEAVLADLDRRVAELERRAQGRGAPRALSYANFGAGGTTAGRGTTLDVVLALAGLVNAAAEAGIDGYESIDHERLLAVDPDIIVVDAAGDAEGGVGAGPQALLYLEAQPELASLHALRGERIVALPTELFTSVSTELLHAAEELQDRLGW